MMNALILENDGREQRTPRVSACKPLCAIRLLRVGQTPEGVLRRNTAVYARTKEKQDKSVPPCWRPAGHFYPQCGQFAGVQSDLIPETKKGV